MSQTATPRQTSEVLDHADDSTSDAETLIELLSDEYARQFLSAIRHEAKPARTIAEDCGASRPTVYRRLNRLQEAGLVTEQMECEENGHHRRTFSATVENVEIILGDDGFEAVVTESNSPSPNKS